jgi:hypothetical protein
LKIRPCCGPNEYSTIGKSVIARMIPEASLQNDQNREFTIKDVINGG